jgi:hypothetical protein
MAYFTNQYRKSYKRPVQSGPRIFPARYDSVCPKCHQAIVADETLIAWTPGQKAVHAECPAPVAPVAPAAPTAVELFAALRGKLQVEDAGVYRLEDGTIVKVQSNKEKSRVYAKRLVEIGGERLTEAGGHVHAEYRYEAGLIDQVNREGVKLTLAEAKALTIRYGFCIRCGRHLKAAQSVEAGLGPVCIRWFEGA